MAENNATEGFIVYRLSPEILAAVPDIASRTVMTCGPALYMDAAEQQVKAPGVRHFFKEKFFTPVATPTEGELNRLSRYWGQK